MALSLKIKTTSGLIIETEADPDLTIYDLKAICCEELNTAPENQTFLFKGKICGDENTLESIEIKDNSTLICLISKKKNKKRVESKEEQEEEEKKSNINSNHHNNSNNTNNNNNPMNMMSMQQELMSNPQLLSQMMENPMMKQMFNNPEILQNIFNSSPALQQLLRDNPQLRHVLKDPSLMKHAMKAAANPEFYNEMLKNNDRALRNIESIPGGFSALSRLYNQIQKPMERAMDDMYRQRFGKSNTKITDIDKSLGPTSKPMENPWSKEYHQKKAILKQQQQQQQQQPQQSNVNMMNMMNMMKMMNGNTQMQAPQNQTQLNASQHYVIQLRELRNMGFNDEQRNVNALVATRGNVGAAIDILTRTRNNRSNDDKNNGNNKK